MLDARGMTIVPGFIDCHIHADGETLLYEVLVGNPYEVEFVTIRVIVDEASRSARAKTPPGKWVEGYFYDDTKVKDERGLNAHDLDGCRPSIRWPCTTAAATPSFYNSKAFEMAGVTKEHAASRPAARSITIRDGELNGRVTDTAQDVLWKVGQRVPSTASAEKSAAPRPGIAHISKQFARYGLTTVHHEGGNFSALMQSARTTAS